MLWVLKYANPKFIAMRHGIRNIFVVVLLIAFFSNLWLFSSVFNSPNESIYDFNFSSYNFIDGFLSFSSQKMRKMMSAHISKDQLNPSVQKILDSSSEFKPSDYELATILEKLAAHRLKCIIEKTESLRSHIKADGHNRISELPAQCSGQSQKSYMVAPLAEGYPQRNFQTYCTNNVAFRQPDFLSLGHIKSQINLAIGMATVSRPQESYLVPTLQDLFSKATAEEMEDVAVIVFLADVFDQHAKDLVKQQIKQNFQSELDAGDLMVVEAPPEYYPPLTKLKRNFNDDPHRVYWRSKQCIDFSFIFSFAHNISKYYLHLEDDVTTKHGYATTIKESAAKMTDGFFEMEFSTLGFIAKLFRSEDLLDLAAFHFFNYEEMPVDMLQPVYRRLMTPQSPAPVSHVPSQFQHKGKMSSLKGKKQARQDPYFDSKRSFVFRQIDDAGAFTNIPYADTHRPSNVLKKAGMFWSKTTPKAKDHFTVYLFSERTIEYVLVATGDEAHPNDHAVGARMEYSDSIGKRMRTRATCGQFKPIGYFEHPVFAANLTSLGNIGCIRLYFPEDWKSAGNWLLISDFGIGFWGDDRYHVLSAPGGEKEIGSTGWGMRRSYEKFVANGYKYA